MSIVPFPKKTVTPAPLARQRQQALVEMFLAGRNALTLEAYRADLEEFSRYRGFDDVEKAARDLLSRPHGEANGIALTWRAHLVDRGLAPTTVNRKLAALRSLVKLARVLGRVPWSLEVADLKAEAYRDTRGPGREGFRVMLSKATNARDRCLLRLLHDLALRRSEVIRLDLADVDLAGNRVAVIGKGRKAKEWLTLPEQTRAALAEWIRARGNTPGSALFTSFDPARKGSGRLSGAGLYAMVRKLGKQAGFVVRPHGLRHGGITEALDLTNGNVRAVQRYSRHRSLATVMIYDDNRLDLGGDVARMVANL